MHEASLMRGLMSQIATLAEAEGAKRVTNVHVWLGALSHMSPDHFREHFDQSSPGSIAEGASLTIDTSDDLKNPNAQEIVIESIEVET